MHALSRWKTCSLCFALAWPVFAAGPALVVDRGLSQANLNNAAGDYRSNVRWSLYDSGFLGDDFSIGAAGESWVIDTIRVWTVPGVNATDPEHLGDFYQDVRLYFGGPASEGSGRVEVNGGLTPIATGMLARGSNQASNANIVISDATESGVIPYDDFGTNMRVWQIDFTHLNLQVQGGVKYQFGAFGLGRALPDKAGKTYAWFNAAANAELAAAKQDGADGQMLLFTSGGKFKRTFDGKGAGWNKSSDINVQVFAHRADAGQ
jgi:hypothetical protein